MDFLNLVDEYKGDQTEDDYLKMLTRTSTTRDIRRQRSRALSRSRSSGSIKTIRVK